MIRTILSHVLEWLGDPKGTLKSLVLRLWTFGQRLFGKAKGFWRAVIKRVLSFVSTRLRPAATATGKSLRESLDSLSRRARAVLDGKVPPLGADEGMAPAAQACEKAPSTPADPIAARGKKAEGPRREEVLSQRDAATPNAARSHATEDTLSRRAKEAAPILAGAIRDQRAEGPRREEVLSQRDAATPNAARSHAPEGTPRARRTLGAISSALRLSLARAERQAPLGAEVYT